MLISIEEEEECHVVDSCVEWVNESTTSYHATSNKEFFIVYKVGDFGKVKTGNSSMANIIGIGDVCIQTNNGCTLTLQDVQHVPDLRLNMISLYALDLVRYRKKIGDGKWKLTKGSLMVAKDTLYSMLCKNKVKLIRDGLNAVEMMLCQISWHRRLAHLSEKGLQFLIRKSLIPSNKGAKLNPCDYCLFGKHHRVYF